MIYFGSPVDFRVSSFAQVSVLPLQATLKLVVAAYELQCFHSILACLASPGDKSPGYMVTPHEWDAALSPGDSSPGDEAMNRLLS